MSDARTPSCMLRARGARIAELFQHCRLLESLDEILQQSLPDGLEGHCRVLNYDGRRLVLRTDSPAWNTLLRYHTPDLLTRLRRHAPLRGLASLHIRTAPATPEAKPRDTAPPRGLGPDTAALVRSLADTMNDERLRLALRRLADRHTTAE